MNFAESGLHQLFKAQATATPNTPAIAFGAEQTSYAQLDQATDALGAYLRRCGVLTDDPVGIYMETCPEYIAATIGILKAGAALHARGPGSPRFPSWRIGVRVQPKVVITKARHLPRLSKFTGPRLLAVDSDQSWREFDPQATKFALTPAIWPSSPTPQARQDSQKG